MSCDTCRLAFHTCCDRHICGIPQGMGFLLDTFILLGKEPSCYEEGQGVKVNCSCCDFYMNNDCVYDGKFQCIIQEKLVHRAYPHLKDAPGDTKEGTLDEDALR